MIILTARKWVFLSRHMGWGGSPAFGLTEAQHQEGEEPKEQPSQQGAAAAEALHVRIPRGDADLQRKKQNKKSGGRRCVCVRVCLQTAVGPLKNISKKTRDSCVFGLQWAPDSLCIYIYIYIYFYSIKRNRETCSSHLRAFSRTAFPKNPGNFGKLVRTAPGRCNRFLIPTDRSPKSVWATPAYVRKT